MLEAVDLHGYSQLIGYVAGGLTTSSFVPQVVRTWKTNGQGLSWAMLGLFGAGIALWLTYGLVENSQPMILANALTLVQIILIAGIKLLKRGRRA